MDRGRFRDALDTAIVILVGFVTGVVVAFAGYGVWFIIWGDH